MLGLLDEDEGRPAELLTKLDVDVGRLRVELPMRVTGGRFLAPSDDELFAAARGHSSLSVGTRRLTTDLVLLAVVVADDEFAGILKAFGVRRGELEGALARPDVVAVPDASAAVFILPDQTDQHDSARVVDANLNRTREALRVLEDYARFGLNDRFLTERLKSLRHQLAEATEFYRRGCCWQHGTRPGMSARITAGGEYRPYLTPTGRGDQLQEIAGGPSEHRGIRQGPRTPSSLDEWSKSVTRRTRSNGP